MHMRSYSLTELDESPQPLDEDVSKASDCQPRNGGVVGLNKVRNDHRIAFLLPNLRGGGMQKTTLTIASAFLNRGYPVDLLLCSDSGPLLQQVPAGMRNILLEPSFQWATRWYALGADPSAISAFIKPVLFSRKPSKTLRFLPSLVRYLREQTPTAVLSATVHLNIEAVLAKQIASVPTRIVITQSTNLPSWHALSEEWRRRDLMPLLRRAYSKADGVISVSKGVGEELINYAGLLPGSVTPIYNPAVTPEIEGLSAEPVNHAWFRHGEPPIVLSVGRPGRQKDLPTLLKAFARARHERVLRLVILGECSDPSKKRRRVEEITALAVELGISQDVALLGFVQNPYAYMKRAAVFVLSSRHEGFGNVIAEALACGCPVVSTDSPYGPAEILDNGKYGRLVPVGDHAALCQAILSTLNAPRDSATLKLRANNFTLERTLGDYERILTTTA